ncbi:hypothetical protein THIOM_004737 [Candidatus Thiomargarita nelsonii]|uniref:Uncharacterized protein n=1 Tax=Candidatus Thiomargarita nelsonii TaxID=1003181 RepID=A0A176RV66_9GAMM|nr:hypothetical protein THIOM_004737 [Candidatus Thiomargarita nelsonii]
MKYLISTPKPTNLTIKPTQFTSHLKAKWLNIDIHTINNPKRVYGLEWVMPMENGNLEGLLERTGQCIALDGDVRDCAKFALWFRSLVDNQYPLFFYDQAYSADLELREYTTKNDIVKCFMFTPVEESPQPIETVSTNMTFFNHPITQSFIENLKRHGVDNTLINKAIEETCLFQT